MTITTCVFDAYGTLFDVNAATQAAAREPAHAQLADVWPAIARDWRAKQLEYSWLRAVADQHCDFWQVTQDGLDWALEASGITNEATRKRLLDLYWELQAYPEAPQVLTDLRAAGMKTAILSNGSPEMLNAAVQSAQIDPLLDATLSVQDVGIFKPSARVYDMVGNSFGCAKEDVLFVSSNGWDAAGAAGYGFQTAWVNRAGAPVDRLYAAPHHIVSDLTAIPGLV
ncbi:haloacid dehalogenase type II [Yoonia sp. I 8.24]|uniref:haloacid dehalogenase type II n=1 Tax=Yoonia sp. I 8.24 TaxID=1537229 RepID=UPI001EDF31AA|nr:haloacid dehalogenase type II [Yoonia sp. I 8.24]MCG3267029.1 haloacid dehalogenase type II [Yoonia sp. I 8.24]